MSEYRPPLDDMGFVMSRLVDLPALLELAPDLSEDTVSAILEEAGRFATGVIAPLNIVGDRVGAKMDDAGNVVMPPGFKAAYQQYVDAGWGTLAGPSAYGGQEMPHIVTAAVGEMWKSANLAFSANFLLTTGAVEALSTHGSVSQRERYLPKLVTGEWCGVMNLTEPQAGSDLAAIRTRALPQPDGSYRIFGQKCFITYADHDMASNIVHMVLARTPDAPPGLKGISMFVVSGRNIGSDGTPNERNDVRVTALEKKLGQHASPTCVVVHGDNDGAVGELVGDLGAGLVYIFVMVNSARLGVALEGLGVSERALQQAAEFAETRLQGRLPGSEQSVSIARHPDVRRMLLTMKAQTEAMRAVAYVMASWLDTARRHPNAEERSRHQDLVDIMIPVAKAWMTETGADVASLCIQVHGGAGYVEETGAAQYLRDVRVAAIYEGTTGIQAADLVGRKIARLSGGATLRLLLDEMEKTASRLNSDSDEDLRAIGSAFGEVLASMTLATDAIIFNADTAPTASLAVSVPFLIGLGVLMGGWQMGRAALAIQDGETSRRTPFETAKLETARHYAEHVLPKALGLSFTVQRGLQSVTSADVGNHILASSA